MRNKNRMDTLQIRKETKHDREQRERKRNPRPQKLAHQFNKNILYLFIKIKVLVLASTYILYFIQFLLCPRDLHYYKIHFIGENTEAWENKGFLNLT